MAQKPNLNTEELKRRKREKIFIYLLIPVILIFTGVEIYLFKVSTKLPFVNSIFFFGLMNINLILFMVLLFLVFRNAIKLILDERKGRIGSKLKTRLVFSFLLFTIIPTILLFTVSAFYIKSSFDKWFSVKVGETLHRSIEIVKHYYENTKKNGSHFVKKVGISSQHLSQQAFLKKLDSLRQEYDLDAIEFYETPLSNRIISAREETRNKIPPAPLETLKLAFLGNHECRIQSIGSGELVRCGLFLGAGKGVIYADYFIPLTVSSQLSDINVTYQDFLQNNPLNYPIKSTYFTILSMLTLLLIFAATWTGFYIAKRLTIPIEELSKGTEAVTRGDLDYQIPSLGSDEFLKLIRSFNQMTHDLKVNKEHLERNQDHLQQVNRELEQRKRYIEVLLESVQSAVISLDSDGLISMANPAAAELLNIPLAEIIRKPYWSVLPQKHRDEIKEILNSIYGTAKPVRKEIKIITEKRRWMTLLVTFSILRDEDKKYWGVVVVIEDVTEVQRMERLSAWQEIAKRMAHEIKNPLTPIQLSVERLRRRYLDKIADDGTFDQATHIILKEVDSLKTLVNEFSSFARMPELRPIPCELNKIVLDAVNLFRAAHEKIHFDIDLHEQLPLIPLDPQPIKRALINLFDNAVTAMNGTGTIHVRTRHLFNSIQLSVIDQGCGISDQIVAHLFEPYFSTKEGGTGLGLAIVQRIIHEHGATVRVSKNAPQGTCFDIEFSLGGKLSPEITPVSRLDPPSEGMT